VHDDVRTFDYQGQVDCLVGGFPCQDLSVAGRRAGLAGERSGLFYDAIRIADRVVRPGGFLVLENVAGLLSSNGGRDFAIVLRSLADIGFAQPAWRMLDSQHFRVPQRRRRVFIVACRSESDNASKILGLTESSSGNCEKGGQERQQDPSLVGHGTAQSGKGSQDSKVIANALTKSPSSVRCPNDDAAAGNHVVAVPEPVSPVANALCKNTYHHGGITNQDICAGHALVGQTYAPTITKKWSKGSGGFAGSETGNLVATVSPSLGKTSDGMGVMQGTIVRRLTPVECERLQGWPDGWTVAEGPSLVDTPRWFETGYTPDDTCGTKDIPRYEACGDGVTATVAEWLARRLQEFGGNQ
jgi:DNA (cytosine-5)-methyltransferase 1